MIEKITIKGVVKMENVINKNTNEVETINAETARDIAADIVHLPESRMEDILAQYSEEEREMIIRAIWDMKHKGEI